MGISSENEWCCSSEDVVASFKRVVRIVEIGMANIPSKSTSQSVRLLLKVLLLPSFFLKRITCSL